MALSNLSTISITLIIIILFLSVIGLFWMSISNIITSGSENIEHSFESLNINLKIMDVEFNETENWINITVRRSPGGEDFEGLKFIFSNESYSEEFEQNGSLRELEEKEYNFILGSIVEKIKKVSIAPIYEYDSGNRKIGDIIDVFEISS